MLINVNSSKTLEIISKFVRLAYKTDRVIVGKITLFLSHFSVMLFVKWFLSLFLSLSPKVPLLWTFYIGHFCSYSFDFVFGKFVELLVFTLYLSEFWGAGAESWKARSRDSLEGARARASKQNYREPKPLDGAVKKNYKQLTGSGSRAFLEVAEPVK